MSLILPSGQTATSGRVTAKTTTPIPGNFTPKKSLIVGGVTPRARYWHDYEHPGDVAHALVRAELDHRPAPVPTLEHCPNRDCRVCHPSREDVDRLKRGHHI